MTFRLVLQMHALPLSYRRLVVARPLNYCSYFLEAFSKVLSLWGQIDIVCNNAAVLDEDNWNRTLNTNLVGFWSSLEVLPLTFDKYK